MRILMLTSDFYDTGHGGVEGHLLGISRSLSAQGHSVVIVRNADRPIIHSYRPEVDGVDYIVLGSVSVSARKWAKRFRLGGRAGLIVEFLRRVMSGGASAAQYAEVVDLVGHVDVVHQHSFLEASGLTRRFASRGIRVVWTNHLGEFLYIRRIPIFGRFALRMLTRHYAAAAAPSAELADQGAISAPVSLIPNGVDTDRFRPSLDTSERDALRQAFGWPSDRRVVIVPRRWAPTKGVLYAAEALGLPTWPTGTFVVFAGSGTEEYPGYAREIQNLLDASNQQFVVYGSVSQRTMAEMLRAADICLIPSVKEATSLSALEAMASGVKVVAARVGGLPEIVVEGRTGYLHEPRDAESIANSVARALATPDASLSAREFVCAGYSWDSIARRTAEMYLDPR